jgi:hypothetical protein
VRPCRTGVPTRAGLSRTGTVGASTSKARIAEQYRTVAWQRCYPFR